jgi:membrane protease subunit HflK
MPWSNQSGGGNGGPWRPNPGPWGSGPQSSGPRPPDLEDLLRRSQERLKTMIPGGGSFGGRGAIGLVLILILLWAFSGFYTVQSNEEGVVLRFGAYNRRATPGLNYHIPYPIESVLTPAVALNRRTDVGLRVSDDSRRTSVGLREVPQESLMLTGDENIVDINFSVFWVIKDAPKYLFNIQNPEATIKAVAESAMREVIGRSELQQVLTMGRQTIEASVHEQIQRTLDSYGAGVQITQVQMQKVDPPQQVIDSFRDVQAARADQERLQNEAQTYANRVVPESRGQAAGITQGAEAYRDRVIAEATGQADRFTKVRDEYAKAPEVTRRRIFLETMEHVLSGANKVIIDQPEGQGVVPYLPLDALDRARTAEPSARPAPAAAPRPATSASTGANR